MVMYESPESLLTNIRQMQAADRRRANADREAMAIRKRRRRWWQKNSH
jgi:hypothetical protein